VLEAEERALHAGLREKILHCLLQMPIGADRDILLLRYYAGLAVQEIARLSSRTANAVHQALLRAHRHLARIAEPLHPEILEYLPEDERDDE
jgi:DNA-directed RNA polymerase specialized sigma24 family protein